MALQFSGKIESSYELIKAGEYELVLKMNWDKTMNGDKYISCCYTIRDDVAQEHQGRIPARHISHQAHQEESCPWMHSKLPPRKAS